MTRKHSLLVRSPVSEHFFMTSASLFIASITSYSSPLHYLLQLLFILSSQVMIKGLFPLCGCVSDVLSHDWKSRSVVTGRRSDRAVRSARVSGLSGASTDRRPSSLFSASTRSLSLSRNSLIAVSKSFSSLTQDTRDRNQKRGGMREQVIMRQ